MKSSRQMKRFVFPRPFTKEDEQEANARGYLSHVLVELEDGRLYAVFFYDAVRLQQDLKEEAKHGRPFIADPGMIVLPEVTLAAMETVVRTLCEEGYFDYLRPVEQEQVALGADSLKWPPPHLEGDVPHQPNEVRPL